MSKKYTKEEERVNSLSHAVGVVMGVVVCSLFIVKGTIYGDAVTQLSLWLYMFGVVSSYVFSTLYHSAPEDTPKRLWLRKLDHAAIYWHIAASYSPITLIVLRDADYWGWGIFIFCWLCAIIGTFISLFSLKKHNYIETACFVLMGLVILVAIKHFYIRVDGWVFFWILAEGVSYIIGAVLYSLHKVKYIHSVFHFFVLLGDICHMIAMWMIVQTSLKC
ncbi:MAG: hemolysin III family protein [Bacteroidaceae bacterium]|nr:hemolysin III family protein [Bacteroidaceae bacterium]